MDNRSLRDLRILVGDWRIELANAAFLDSGATMSGTMTGSWLDGAFLVLRTSMDAGGPPASISVVGRNESRDDYEVLYADGRGVSRIYRMTFADGVWIQERADPGFHQRFRGTVASDGSRISASWHKSHDDGRTWEHDFDLSYTRLG